MNIDWKKVISYARHPFSFFEWMLALRYLKGRRKEQFVSVITWFSLVGIALGVATLIIVLSVFGGFKATLLDKILGLNGHILVYSSTGSSFPNHQKVIDKINEDKSLAPQINKVIPLVEGKVMLASNGSNTGGILRGMSREDLMMTPMLNDKMFGKKIKDLKENEILIGDKLANRFGLTLGDELTITSAQGNITAFGMMPRIRSYRIGGIFHTGMFQYDSAFVFMPIETAQLYFNMPQSVSHLEIFVEDLDDLSLVQRLLKNNLGNGYQFRDFRSLNTQFFQAIQIQRSVAFIVVSLVILVAAFNIISGLVMLVKDKGKDIAVLRTVGMSRASVMRVFFLAGSYIGFLGTFFGTLGGVLFASNIEGIRKFFERLFSVNLFSAEVYVLSELPSRVDFWEVAFVALFALLLSFLAAVYPAWRASKLDPVEALRYE